MQSPTNATGQAADDGDESKQQQQIVLFGNDLDKLPQKELHLFARFQGENIKNQPENARSYANLRVYKDEELKIRIQEKFNNIDLPDEIYREVINEATKRVRVEAAATYEFPSYDKPPSVFKSRLRLLGFRFNRFLNTLKKVEDEEHLNELEKTDLEQSLHGAKSRLEKETAFNDNISNLVEHMVKYGVEEHFKLVREKMFGDNYLGVTVSLKDFNINLLKQKRFRLMNKSSRNGSKKTELTMGVTSNGDEEEDDEKTPEGIPTLATACCACMCCCCFAGFAFGMKHCRRGGNQFEEVPVLKDINIALKPGRLTLLLGPPHAGKTRLMHAIAGREKSISGLKSTTGNISFNGYDANKVNITNFVTVVEEIDNHLPQLTVRETLQFAFDCKSYHNIDEYIKTSKPKDPEFAKKILIQRVDMILALLGLTRASNTVIGNENIKGISGGEKRRVTLGEMLVAGSKVLLLDEISTGLDSAATYDITLSLRALCKAIKATVLISLLLPAPETINLFDDILLMNSGMVAYHGPTDKIQEYFASIGYVCPKTKDLGDFLQEIMTETDQVHYMMNEEDCLKNGVQLPIPRTAEEFSERFKQTEWFQETNKILQSDPAGQHVNNWFENYLIKAGSYRNSFFWLLKVVTERQWKLMLRNKGFIFGRIIQNVVLGLLQGALFWQIPFAQYYLFSMIYLNLTMFMGFASLSLIPDMVAQRRIFYKQHKESFFSATVYVVAQFIVGIPFSCADGIVLGSLVYFMSGMTLSDNGSHYFVFLTLGIAFGVTMSSLVRLNSYFFRSREGASGITVLFIVLMSLFSGGVATASVIPNYFIWIYWLNPCAWIYRSMMQNQFLSSQYQGDTVNVNGQCVAYCANPNFNINPPCPPPFPSTTCGNYFLEARQFITDPSYLWAGFGICLMYTIIFLLLTICTLKYVRHDEVKPVIFTPKSKVDKMRSPSKDNLQALNNNNNNNPADAVAIDAQKMAQIESAKSKDAVSEQTDPVSKQSDLNQDKTADDDDQQHSTSAAATTTTATEKPPIIIPGFPEMRPDLAAALAEAPKIRPASLAFRNIRYTVDLTMDNEVTGEKEKVPVDLLKNVSGFAKPYQLTALMGSSGAGKTTLLDVLALRKTVGAVTGEIFVNGKPMLPKLFRRTIGYVEQFGVHSPLMTVHESLKFSASLRLPTYYTNKAKEAYIALIEHILELESIRDRQVGTITALEGLSFEEHKRLTIGVELVANPSILFCDEPTSGLDARAAEIVVNVLKRAASRGRAIICTIHQPSIAVFEKFDRLLLMKRGGEVVYFGDIGTHSSSLINYFMMYPTVRPIQNNYNPATWMLEIIGAGISSGKNQKTISATADPAPTPENQQPVQQNQTIDFAHEYLESDLYHENMATLDSLLLFLGNRPGEGGEFGHLNQQPGDDQHSQPSSSATPPPPSNTATADDSRPRSSTPPLPQNLSTTADAVKKTRSSHKSITRDIFRKRFKADELFSKTKEEAANVEKSYARSKWYQMRLVIKRSFTEYWRYPSYTLLRWMITLFFGIVMGLLFLKQVPENAAGVQSRVSVIAMLMVLLGNYNLNNIIPFLFNDKALFYREKSSAMYSPVIYAMSKQFVEDPYIVLEVIFSITCFYFMVGLIIDAGLFFYYLFVAFLYVETMTFIGMFFASVLPSPAGASLISSLFGQVSSMFAGTTVPGPNIPTWLLGLYYFVPMRWAQEGLITTQFEYDYTIICDPNGIPDIYNSLQEAPTTCNGTVLAPATIYNPVTQVTQYACCSSGNCPITARDFVLYGYTNYTICPNVISPFLGGTNGYSYSFRWWDVLYVSSFLVITRVAIVIAITNLSFQKR